ncbi:MAG: methyl-accepting chemotaxis protein [Desulfitobacterium sp.]|nr:methyl-accepting chemotaxis protein [Desulfitobacterium sp.]
MLFNQILIESKHSQELVESYRQEMFDVYDDSIKKEVQTIIHQIEHFYNQSQEGLISEEEAKEIASQVIASGRYGDDGSGIFWADTYDGYFISSGTGGIPAGTYRIDSQDALGNYFVRTFIENAQKPEGGYSEYYYPRPIDVDPSQAPLPKRSYSAGFEPWGWAIGTGNYVVDIEEKILQYENELLNAKRYKMFFTILGYVLVLAAAFVSAFLVNRNIRKRIDPMSQMAKAVSEGKLNVNLLQDDGSDSIGELGKSLNIMVENLNEIVSTTQDSATNVALTAEQMSQSLDQTAQTSEQVVRSIGEVVNGTSQQENLVHSATDAVNEVSNIMNAMLDSSNQLALKSEEVASSAQDGEVSIQRTVDQMERIEETVRKSAQVVKTLGESSIQISNIVDTIGAIATQTNLLSLNASIEAARAGEAGRGFAVVAEEVRKLAEESRIATEEISELTRTIQTEAENAILAMDTGIEEVSTGSEVVNKAGDTFKGIALLIQEMSDNINQTVEQIQFSFNATKEVESMMAEINKVSGLINEEVIQISSATQEQSAAMEEVSASSESLAEMADALNDIVSRFEN